MAMTSLLKSQISGSIPASVSIARKLSIPPLGINSTIALPTERQDLCVQFQFATRSFTTRGILVFTKTPNTPKTEWLFFTCISSAKESSGSAIDDMGFSTGVWAPFAFPEQSKNEPGPGRWKGQDASILAPDNIAAIILGVVLPCDTRLLEGDPVATSTFAESSSSAICKPGKAACLVVNTDGFVLWGDSLDPLDAAMVGMLADPEAGAGMREVQLLPFFLVYVATTLPDFDAVRGWHRACKGAHAKGIPVEELFEQLKCTKEGLSSDDGANRLHVFGPNKLEKKASCI